MLVSTPDPDFVTEVTHIIERTSPKGGDFLGRCTRCGAENLKMEDALKPCSKTEIQVYNAFKKDCNGGQQHCMCSWIFGECCWCKKSFVDGPVTRWFGGPYPCPPPNLAGKGTENA